MSTTTIKALVLDPKTAAVTLKEVAKPSPGAGEILIRVKAISLNMLDGLLAKYPIADSERVIGLDFAGVVEGAGDDLAASGDKRTKSGTRVSGFLQGACSVNFRPGAFAEYIVAPYDLTWAIPSGMTFEEASTTSMCGLTAAQGLFDRMGLPSPFSTGNLGDSDKTKDPINVLVYGASSSLGMYAAQLARVAAAHAGRELRLIGTALKSKHALLSSPPYSYDVLIDYRDPDWPAQVRAATHGAGVQYAVDTISEGETPFQVESTLSDNGKFATFRADYDTKRLATLRIQPVYGAAWEGLGEEVHFGHGVVFPASARGRAFAATFYLWLSEGDQVKIVPNPVRLMPGGLERVPADGLALVSDIQLSARKEGARSEEYMRPISGEKIVYTVA